MSKMSWKTVFSYKVSLYKWVKMGSSKNIFHCWRFSPETIHSGPPWTFRNFLILLFLSFLIDNRGNLFRSDEAFVLFFRFFEEAFKFPNRIMINCRQRQWQMLMEDVKSHRSKNLIKSNFKAPEFPCQLKSQQQKQVLNSPQHDVWLLKAAKKSCAGTFFSRAIQMTEDHRIFLIKISKFYARLCCADVVVLLRAGVLHAL